MAEGKGELPPGNGQSVLAAMILCGGRSARMGRDKAAIELGGAPLIVRVERALAAVAHEVIVVAAPQQALPDLPHARVVRDDAPYGGPLAGLARGTRELAPDVTECFVAGTDYPALHPAVIIALVRARGHRDAALFEKDGQRALLCGVYTRRALDRVASLLEDGARSVKAWVATLDVRIVSAEELLRDEEVQRHDPTLRSFEDVDDEAALARFTARR